MTAKVDAKVDLAREADFVLGGLSVSPSACRVTNGSGDERVEPRVMEVLIVLHRNAGRTVTRDELIEACWDGRAVSDDAVTRAIMKARQLGRGDAEPPHFTIETVPKVGFRLTPAPAQPLVNENEPAVAPAGGLPPSSASQLMPERARASHGIWIAAAIAAAVAVAAFGLAVGWDRQPQAPDGQVRVALSPFRALQKTDELDRLSRKTDEAVARWLTARGIATVVAGASPSSGSPAADTGLAVTGVVDREGDAYTIKTTLGLPAGNIVLYSDTFERKVSEPEGLHEQAAKSLASVLGCALKERKSAATMSAEIFSLLLHSCAGPLEPGLEAARRLVEKAPHLAGAHAHHALYLAWNAEQLDYLSNDAARFAEEARVSAERALALDPNSVAAHFALSVRTGRDPRFAERERHFARVLEIEPGHLDAVPEYGQLLREVGRIGAAREMFQRVDMSSSLIKGAFVAAMSSYPRDAFAMIERLAVLHPAMAREVRWVVTVWWEEPAGALQHIERIAKEAGRTRELACVMPHLQAIVRKQTVRGLGPDCDHFDIDWRVRLLARQGDIDGAYGLMAQPFPNSRSPAIFLFYPEMKRFRQDKRFMPLAEKLGLVSYWRDTNNWPDFCAEPDLPYECRT